MSFARQYIQRNCIFEAQISQRPSDRLGMIVVIPCFNEPDIIKSLDSLKACEQPPCAVEIIVVINSGEGEEAPVIHQNQRSEKEIENWLATNSSDRMRFFYIHKRNLPRKHAGVGLARKIGMDEATCRFNQIDKPDGIIVSFDADSTCAQNYLTEIYNQYSARPKGKACSIYFEHPISGQEFQPAVYKAIAEYELYLRYYNQALRYCGYPYAFHTVGSSFAVRVRVYAAQGGMNRKQAGEDFYFLQKIIPLGGYFEINSTCVLPSPRPSDRVPFGTGAMINTQLGTGEGISTYPFELFELLLILFADIGNMFQQTCEKVENFMDRQPEILKDFLKSNSFVDNLSEINANSPTQEKFNIRFFKWFNAFRILKFLNFAIEKEYPRKPILQLANRLGREIGFLQSDVSDVRELLFSYRKYEKENVCSSGDFSH